MYETQARMQDRPLFPDGVVVEQQDLAYEAAARAYNDLQRQVDTASMGVVTGLGVTINADPRFVDLAAGRGYAAGGALIDVPTEQASLTVADLTSGIVNVVAVFYTETQEVPRGHESDGTSPNTRAIKSYRVRVYTQAQFDALPATSLDNAVDALDRALVCAYLFPVGGVVSSVVSPRSLLRAVGAEWATPGSGAINGIDIVAIDQQTATSEDTGSVGRLFFSPSPSPNVAWRAPEDANQGTPVNVSTGAVFTLTSQGGRSIDIIVDESQLPSVAEDEAVYVYDLYADDVVANYPRAPRYSAVDTMLRSFRGSGLPTEANPLGLSFADLSGPINTKGDITTAGNVIAGFSVTVGDTYNFTSTKTRVQAIHAAEMQGNNPLLKSSVSVDKGGVPDSQVVLQSADIHTAYVSDVPGGGYWARVLSGATPVFVTIPVRVPHGNRISVVKAFVVKAGTLTMQMTMYKKRLGDTAPTVLAATDNSSASGPVTLTASFISPAEVVDSEYSYFALLTLPEQNDVVHMAEVTYETDSLWNGQ